MNFSFSTSVLLPAVSVSSIPQPQHTVPQQQVTVSHPQAVTTTVTATLGGFMSSAPTISAPDPVKGY